MYFYYPKKWFSIGHSSGFFKNSVFTGPIGTIELGKGLGKGNFSLNTLHWLGWSFGDPEEESTKEFCGKLKFILLETNSDIKLCK